MDSDNSDKNNIDENDSNSDSNFNADSNSNTNSNADIIRLCKEQITLINNNAIALDYDINTLRRGQVYILLMIFINIIYILHL
jgi:hypothetical protein